MQVNRINSNQSFGAINISSYAQENIVRRIGNKPAEMDKLKGLVEQQKNNPFDIVLDSLNGHNLYGWVADGATYYQDYYENGFCSLFKSPISFIEKLCKDANKQLEKSKEAEALSEIIKNQ